MDGEDIQEPPEPVAKKETPANPSNPHLSTEEGMILNTNRKGYDTSMDDPKEEEDPASSQKVEAKPLPANVK